MGFMDSVTSFAQGVSTKAKGNMDVVALNTQVSATTKEINNLFKTLGERYYNLHKDSPEEELKDLVNDISEKYEKIKQLEDNIEATKETISAVQLVKPASAEEGSRFCPKCGASVAPDNLFCVKCGTRVPENHEENNVEFDNKE